MKIVHKAQQTRE